MAGRSLWSVLMVAWLSASNAAVPTHDPALSNTPITEQERDSDVQPPLDTSTVDEADVATANDAAKDAP